MSVQEPKAWITGEEFAEARRRLLEAGFDEASPEFQQLLREVDERDDYLWERYAKPLMESHYGEWAAVSTRGEVILRATSEAAHLAAREQFGPGNFAYGRLTEFRGIDMSRC